MTRQEYRQASEISDAVRIALSQPNVAIDAREVAKAAQGWAEALDRAILDGIIARGETHRLQPIDERVNIRSTGRNYPARR